VSWWTDVKQQITESPVWQSIFRHGYDDTPRNRILMVSGNVWLHLHPSKVRRHATRMRFTWCMGGITFLMFLITVVTGVYLMFYYRPVAQYAYADMKYLEFDMPFGMLMRNMHRWAAHGMVIAVWLHMFRVFLTGSYKPPREFNWVVGVILFVLTLLLSFTGYLLPWDQLAFWAITVGSNIGGAAPLLGQQVNTLLLGDLEISQNTLIRFYTLHVIALPLVLSLLLSIHFWRVRQDGGITQPL
jgi:quinol-cytochrome oxidoreductase complex cytochrome b subunit